ncbi:galectin-3b [Syngnathus scovelli]|uniref:galectin-3b n=1 Tax=Syngnathus scovelli TaxID=161590 RepID=UPI00210FAF17|nr:galectin-3b [Syngnathus scovelli]
MNLSDALDDSSSSGASSQSVGSKAWPQQPNQSQWPGGSTNPTWGGGASLGPGQQPSAGGQSGPQWPGQQPSAGGQGGPQWPGQQPSAGGQSGTQWPGQQPSAGGQSGPQWPGQQPSAGGQSGPQWPGQQPSAGGQGGSQWPGQQPVPGGQGGSQWPGQQPVPGGGGAQWPTPSPGAGNWPAPSPGIEALGSLKVPYNQKLPNGLRSGSVIHIKGNINSNADRVTVDLSTDRDLMFHFNPRFNESGRKVIVRNSRIGGRWGNEERNLTRFPFAAGQPFEMKIECTSSMFKVSVQGSHLLEFKLRGGNPSQIRSLDIYNDLSLSHVSIQ